MLIRIISFIFLILFIWGGVYLLNSLFKAISSEKYNDENDIVDDNVEINGNDYQCPLCLGKYVFYERDKAYKLKNNERGDNIQKYIDFNNLEIDSIRYEDARLDDFTG